MSELTETVVIRPARPNEADTLADIEATCFPPAEAASREQVHARLALFPENFLVAEIDGKPVGFLNGATTDRPALPDALYHDASLHIPDGAYMTVFGLNVLPDFRRKGIAAQLLRAYEGLARVRGKKGLVLTCKEHLIHYYERFGYVNHGIADSAHGGQVWYDMQYHFE